MDCIIDCIIVDEISWSARQGYPRWVCCFCIARFSPLTLPTFCSLFLRLPSLLLCHPSAPIFRLHCITPKHNLANYQLRSAHRLQSTAKSKLYFPAVFPVWDKMCSNCLVAVHSLHYFPQKLFWLLRFALHSMLRIKQAH